jgi:16S rRNA (guanine527-N7)-methyltransferase
VAPSIVCPEDGWPLVRAATSLDVSLPESMNEPLSRWLDLLVTWNARVDLTAARSPDELVDLMLADALVLSRYVAKGARVVDIGTGAGAPGLALAIVRPDLEVTLVEPLAKRRAFLRTVLGTLGLSRVHLDGGKGELVAKLHGHFWNVALARATLAPAPWLALADALCREVDGSAWVFLAKEPNPENPAFEVAEDVAYTWPLTGAARRLVRYVRPESARGLG